MSTEDVVLFATTGDTVRTLYAASCAGELDDQMLDRVVGGQTPSATSASGGTKTAPTHPLIPIIAILIG